MINIQMLVSEIQCYETVRKLRWPNGVVCVECKSTDITRNGHKGGKSACQKYQCRRCNKHFDDLTNTVFSGHHQPLKVWILCLYFMGLNLSNRQIGQELDINESTIYEMTSALRSGVEAKVPEVTLSGEVEMDEVYVVAGHKGQPSEVEKRGGKVAATV